MPHSNRSYLFFFFFQAEDGIRDYKVTGVQTCALPICAPGEAARLERLGAALDEAQRPLGGRANAAAVPLHPPHPPLRDRVGVRSEERRVGKECRSRWSPYH